ncbi:MAG: AAA family ATPase [Eggerthellaceae bacterium]|nr:AAA family ATPase [Eggerthellaceae bacterium]
MKRHIDNKLNAWIQSAHRKPLLLFGARQVGKTYALKKLAAQCCKNIAYVDFSRDLDALSVFEGSIRPADIVLQLEALLGIPIESNNTLIVLDEIQLSERALTSLKYFCEDAPEYAVAAAGSLLGVKVNRGKYSFPVGKVDMLTLYPMNFEEYLWARGEERLSGLVRGAAETDVAAYEKFNLHDRAMDLLREYFLVGGMPEAVQTYVDACDHSSVEALDKARIKLTQIDQAYVADMTKYSTAAEAPRIFEAWQSIPGQLAKENHKFQYAKIRSGARASQYETALAWLEAAGIVARCTHVSDGIAPLKEFEKRDMFKLYMADTGLLSCAYDVLPQDVLPSGDKAARFRGGLAENYTMQQLTSCGVQPYYWGVASKSEVEFVARSKQGDVIPIEVKSGENVRANSLMAYREKYKPPYVVRTSAKNFGYANGIASIPLYAIGFFAEQLR